MLSILRKYSLLILLGIISGLGTGCQKDIIAPANQNIAFVKYYGHIASQEGEDLIATLDGGYIMVGSTNSYTNDPESDVFVVKTDSLGNEMWSTSFGRANDQNDPNHPGAYLKFDEDGVKIIELPDGSGYTVAANRTYYQYASETALKRDELQTKIVLYSLDLTGMPTNGIAGTELLTATNATHTEEVSDIKLDTAGGIYRYVLTGYTTNVSSAPTSENATDVLTASYSSNFVLLWQLGSLAYGFDGSDYGTSVQILSNHYLVCGTSDEKYTDGTVSYVPQLLVVKMTKVGGVPVNPKFFGDKTTYFGGGHSAYNASDGIVTVAGHVKAGSSANPGQIALLQLETEGLSVVTPSPSTFSCRYYNLESRAAGLTPYETESVALLPNRKGVILSSTYYADVSNPASKESNICLAKFDNNLDHVSGWTYFFGRQSVAVNTEDVGGTVLPISSSISGAAQSQVTGYVFTGTFALGTNTMMGLVKVNENGTLTP